MNKILSQILCPLLLPVMLLIGSAGILPAQTDDPLLDDLDSQLLDDLNVPPVPDQPPETPQVETLPKDPTDTNPSIDGGAGAAQPDPLEQLLQGDDIGQGPSDDKPAKRIAIEMVLVKKQLAEGNLSPETRQSQQRILDDLKKLLEEMEKQKQQASSSSAGDTSPQPSQSQNNQQPGKQPNNDPATDSNPERQGPAETGSGAVEETDIERTFEQVWGHLPPKVREQAGQAMSEEFLPKYENLIRQYFQRLAEQEGDRQ